MMCEVCTLKYETRQDVSLVRGPDSKDKGRTHDALGHYRNVLFFNQWYNGWGLQLEHTVRRIQLYLPQEVKVSVLNKCSLMPFAPEAKLICGFLSYILETEDLFKSRWLRGQYSKWSTKRVIAFSSNHDHHWKPSILTKCSNIREWSWYHTEESHGIGPYSLISDSPIMRTEWIYIPFLGCIFVQQSLQFSVTWKCNYR